MKQEKTLGELYPVLNELNLTVGQFTKLEAVISDIRGDRQKTDLQKLREVFGDFKPFSTTPTSVSVGGIHLICDENGRCYEATAGRCHVNRERSNEPAAKQIA
jgi:hypothetical protein